MGDAFPSNALLLPRIKADVKYPWRGLTENPNP
jgi:hypothetical protein